MFESAGSADSARESSIARSISNFLSALTVLSDVPFATFDFDFDFDFDCSSDLDRFLLSPFGARSVLPRDRFLDGEMFAPTQQSEKRHSKAVSVLCRRKSEQPSPVADDYTYSQVWWSKD